MAMNTSYFQPEIKKSASIQNILVFDIGGTLMEYKNMPYSWLDFYKKALTFVRSKLHLNISDADIDLSYEVLKKYNPRVNYREKDFTPEVIFKEATAHWHENFQLQEVINQFFASMNLESYIYPDTVEFLNKFKANGCKIAVLTNVASGMPDELHKSYFSELLPYFDYYVSSESCGYRKPNPKGLQDIAEYFQTSAKDMMMIGDEKVDILTAKRFGCSSVLIDRSAAHTDFGQDYTIHDLSGLWEI